MELCRDAGLSAMRRSAGNLADHRVAFRIPLQDLRVEQEDFESALSQIRPSALRETLISVPNVSWSDIGGLAEVKQRLQDTVELPLRNPQLLIASGLPPHVGALLYGPSGSGKTLLAKALANECGVNFISIDGPEIFTKWLGETEEGLRQIFRIARQVAPTVIFFDQLDAIAPIRGVNVRLDDHRPRGRPVAGRARRRGTASRVIVLGATNRIDLIDPFGAAAGPLRRAYRRWPAGCQSPRGNPPSRPAHTQARDGKAGRSHRQENRADDEEFLRRAAAAAVRRIQTARHETYRLQASGRADHCRHARRD
jgi:ATPases of the AAA+ class